MSSKKQPNNRQPKQTQPKVTTPSKEEPTVSIDGGSSEVQGTDEGAASSDCESQGVPDATVDVQEVDVDALNTQAEKLENDPEEYAKENPRDKIFVGYRPITGEKVYV